MNLERDINNLLRYARRIILRYYNADSCIASTRVACDVMRRLGYKAEPMSVQVTVCNPAMVRKMKEIGRYPTWEEFDKWTAEDGAWNVQIGGRFPNEVGWVCHLVAIINDQVLVDLSLDQASRPHRQMELRPYATTVTEAFLKGENLVREVGDMVLIYKKTDETAWQNTKNWINVDAYGPVTERVYRKMFNP